MGFSGTASLEFEKKTQKLETDIGINVQRQLVKYVDP